MKHNSNFAFCSGALIGSLVTWYITKQKYERLVQEEINSVKEVFAKKTEEPQQADSTENTSIRYSQEKSNLADYTAKLRDIGYQTSTEKEDEVMADKPYVIAPEEFGEFDEYEQISLTFYADGVLADDNDEPIDDVEDIVGAEALQSFGKYEDDSVFVRNDSRRCDYEILLDQRTFAQATNFGPKG